MRAIWRAWETGERLSFRGDFYSHTFMAPLFDPGPNPCGNAPVLLAAVGPKMLEVAGEVADGVLLHPITTRRFVDEVTIPALERGWSKGGRTRADFAITGPRFVATGTNEDELARAIASTRELIGFYGATPNYRTIFELHGWETVHDELRALQRAGKGYAELAEAVPDEVLHTIATVGEPEEVGRALAGDFGGVLDRTACFHNYDSTLELWARVADAMRAESASVGTTTPA
jgi:probable F420-dependent oxidoreductase